MHFEIENYKLRVSYNKEYGISYYQLKKIGKNQESPQNYNKIGQIGQKLANIEKNWEKLVLYEFKHQKNI